MERLYIIIAIALAILQVNCIEARGFIPGPLFAMGQRIPRKGHKSLQMKYISLGSQRKPIKYGTLQFLSGITDRWAWNINLPIINIRDNDRQSTGLGDIQLESEYAFFAQYKPGFIHRLTALAGVYFPSATTNLQTIIASKSYNFLFGLTHALRSNQWHVYAEGLYIVTTQQKNNFKLENTFFYNLGCGTTIYKNGEDDLMVYIEMNNLISQAKNDPNAVNLPATLVLIGPSMRCNFYKGRLSFKAGVQYAICDNGKKYEEHVDYRIGTSLRIYF